MKPRIQHQAGDYVGPRARLYLLDERIRRGDHPSHSTLARHCGVSAKTIQRDIEYMQFNMSCPLEYDPHRKGWHYTDAGFFLPLVFASGTEFQAIKVIGELVAQYDGTPLGEMMEKALERVLSLFKDADAHAVRQLTERICFAGLPTVAINPDVWAAVLTALQRDQRLKLAYRKGGNDPAVERLYDPFGLIVRGRDWFLHGFCHLHGKRSNLYLPYVKTAALVDDFFDLPKDFNLRAFTRAGFQGLQANEHEKHKVVLRFIPEVANVIEMHRFAHDQSVKRDSKGHAVVTFQASALFQVEREVLSWGAKVEVIGPPALRDRMRQIIGELRKKYGKA